MEVRHFQVRCKTLTLFEFQCHHRTRNILTSLRSPSSKQEHHSLGSLPRCSQQGMEVRHSRARCKTLTLFEFQCHHRTKNILTSLQSQSSKREHHSLGSLPRCSLQGMEVHHSRARCKTLTLFEFQCLRMTVSTLTSLQSQSSMREHHSLGSLPRCSQQGMEVHHSRAP